MKNLKQQLENISIISLLLLFSGCAPTTSSHSTGPSELSVQGEIKNNISNTIRIKGLSSIAWERNPELFRSKDEYETTAEYSQLVARKETFLKDIRTQLLAEAEARKKEKARLAAEQAAEEERLLQIKIAESLASVESTPSSIGIYNADNSTFSLTVNYETHTVNIPRDAARTYKPVYKESKVEGFKQLSHDLKSYEYFNMVLVHPLTGKRFPFGPTKNIDSLKFSFQKNLDEKYFGSEIEVTVVKKDGSTVNGVLIKKSPDYVWIQTQDKTPVKIIVDEIEFMSSSTQILNNNGNSTPKQ